MTEDQPLHTDEFITAMRFLMQRDGWSSKTLAKRANELADEDNVGFQVTYAMQVHRVINREAMLAGPKGARTLHYWARALGLSEAQERTLMIAAGVPLEDQQRKAAQDLLRWTSGDLPTVQPPDDDPDPHRARSLVPTTGKLGDLPERVRTALTRRPRRKVVEVVFSELEGRWIDATR